MTNRIEQIRILTKRLTPTEAELHVQVRPTTISPSTEVRGRLMGPRCLFSTTIEIAYALRKIDMVPDAELALRVLIPEPNWWHPDAPFLYEGPIELWESGEFCERRRIRYGLRSVEWKANELRWNGKPLALRGAAVADLDDQRAAELRRQQFNAVLVNGSLTNDILRWADQYGLLVFECSSIDPIPHSAHCPSWMGSVAIGA